MNAQTPTAAARTRLILEDLEAVRENLLALSDDIWTGIDRQDLAAFDEGVRFMRDYVEKTTAFDSMAEELSALIQQYTSVRLEETEQTGRGDRERNERIIAELNRDEPHRLDEDFTYKRPHGFILDGQAATGLTTWQRLYELVCQQLFARDEARFRSLIDHPEFVSNTATLARSLSSLEITKTTPVPWSSSKLRPHYLRLSVEDSIREGIRLLRTGKLRVRRCVKRGPGRRMVLDTRVKLAYSPHPRSRRRIVPCLGPSSAWVQAARVLRKTIRSDWLIGVPPAVRTTRSTHVCRESNRGCRRWK